MLKKQTGIAKKRYRGLDKVYEFNKIEDKTKSINKTKDKKQIKSDQFYSNKFTFFECCNIEKFSNLYFTSKQKHVEKS